MTPPPTTTASQWWRATLTPHRWAWDCLGGLSVQEMAVVVGCCCPNQPCLMLGALLQVAGLRGLILRSQLIVLLKHKVSTQQPSQASGS